MKQNDEWTEDQVLEALAHNRQQLADLEREWKKMREHSKTLCLALITKHGLSMSRVALLSGHHRNTMKIWLDIHNAEIKSAQRAAAATEGS